MIWPSQALPINAPDKSQSPAEQGPAPAHKLDAWDGLTDEQLDHWVANAWRVSLLV